MPIPSTLLGDLSPETFLNEYWQKKPLLIRGALPTFESPLEPGELAGLACEEGVESRLILEEGGEKPWELRFGPFDEEDFLSLPESKWTVLVQEVDRLIPEVADLLDAFAFVPKWRIDDVMVSYAPKDGNVGAHIDNYDVFLLQGQGTRRWEWGEEPVQNEEIVPDLDVRMLKDFEADREAVLEPGDMLYLPPRVAHHGVSLDDECMTYSIGFRAPSHEELIADFMQYAMERIDPDARYGDPDLTVPDEPGEISADALASIRGLLRSLTEDDDTIDRWFGAFVTEPKRDRFAMPLPEDVSAGEIAEAIRSGEGLRRGPATNLAFIPHDDGTASLFANGSEILLGDEIAFAAPLLTGTEFIPSRELTPHLDDDAFLSLVQHLVNDGLLELSPPVE
ncbi:cupin [Longibacter salinarum]|uniref:Cupin n=1 Tax=Longibacter salinarum TaxID=1850348 RepID=A0A2A8D074_9BACT|nr:cupin domain-containing protein [Longibacter salinarum]PEN14316.1 cupin [Longibacter salinarum]